MSSEPRTLRDGADRLAQSRAEINRWLNSPADAKPSARAQSVPELAIRSVLDGTARRHPWALVAGGALAGAAIMLTRRGSWAIRPSLLVSLAAPLASELMSRWLQQSAGSRSAPPPVSSPRFASPPQQREP